MLFTSAEPSEATLLLEAGTALEDEDAPTFVLPIAPIDTGKERLTLELAETMLATC
jgi:hypothetical protein